MDARTRMPHELATADEIVDRILQASKVAEPSIRPTDESMSFEDREAVLRSALGYWYRLVMELRGLGQALKAELARLAGHNDPARISEAGAPSGMPGFPSESPAPGGLRPSSEETDPDIPPKPSAPWFDDDPDQGPEPGLSPEYLAALTFREDRPGVNAREIGGQLYISVKKPGGEGATTLLTPQDAIRLGQAIEKIGLAIIKRDERDGG